MCADNFCFLLPSLEVNMVVRSVCDFRTETHAFYTILSRRSAVRIVALLRPVIE